MILLRQLRFLHVQPLPSAEQLGADVLVRRNDMVTVADVERLVPTLDGIVISPDHARLVKPESRFRSCGGWRARCQSSASASAIRRSARRSAGESSARQDSCTARSR